MWIKWKYNDHGSPNFAELEIPDDLNGEESMVDYLCSRSDLYIPVWSERFMVERIKWEKLDLPEKELTARKVAKLRKEIIYHSVALSRAEQELAKLLDS